MKKIYLKPQMEVVKIGVSQLMAGSFSGENLPEQIEIPQIPDVGDDDTRSRLFAGWDAF